MPNPASLSLEQVKTKFVNSDPKYPKYNNGAILSDNEKWYNVSKEVSIEQFVTGGVYDVEVETNSLGYKTIVKVLKSDKSNVIKEHKGVKTSAVSEETAERIKRQGAIQTATLAVLQSPHLTVKDLNQAKEFIVELADFQVNYVETKKKA